jgi:Icc-related predicted phosphoesterase
MKILIVGDVHGYFGRLNTLINDKRPDLMICCGDFGYWPGIDGLSFEIIKPQDTKILWCDGNHENHWELAKRKTNEIVKNVVYMPRGSVYTLDDGRTILFMGGGDSIDKNQRTLGYDWFPEEIITQKDIENLPDVKVDIVISHTCPLEIIEILVRRRFKEVEPSNHALSYILNRYRPDLWYFGHWHFYKEIFLRDTKFIALSCLPTYLGVGRWWKELE